MRLSFVVLGLCLLGAAVGGWAWLGDDAGMVAPETPAAPGASPGPGESTGSTESDPRVLNAATTVLDAATAGDVDEDTDPDEADRIAAATAPNHSPRIRVVRGDPPNPVRDAVVFFITQGDGEAKARAKPAPTPSRWEWPAAFGQRAVTDADGLVQLPRSGEPWLCSAAVGPDFGFLVVPPRDRVHTLVLQPDETLTLQTKGPDDRPMPAVPLAVLQQFGNNPATPVWQQPAGRDGRAQVRHFQCVRQAADGQGPAERFTAVATVPGAVATMFVGRPAPTETIVVAVPPLASVRAAFVDQRGIP
ncbi:MAG: hypothetical protein JNK15_08385, partial [Planctomycetes bacterium]|nr:hypothetical protein [Planctomycetota bacterium]